VTAASAAPAPQPAPASGPLNFRVALDEIHLKNLAATFIDQAVTPTGQLAARLDDMSIKNVVLDPAQPNAKATLTASASVPGIIRRSPVDRIRHAVRATKHLDSEDCRRRNQPDALAPYLRAAGLESELTTANSPAIIAASVTLQRDGGIAADASLAHVRFDDGKELFALSSAKIGGVAINAAGTAIKAASIELSGPGAASSPGKLRLRLRPRHPHGSAGRCNRAGHHRGEHASADESSGHNRAGRARCAACFAAHRNREVRLERHQAPIRR